MSSSPADNSYTQDLMLRRIVHGPSPDDAVARLTHERSRALATETPTVYLAAHDPDTAARPAKRQVVTILPLNAVRDRASATLTRT